MLKNCQYEYCRLSFDPGRLHTIVLFFCSMTVLFLLSACLPPTEADPLVSQAEEQDDSSEEETDQRVTFIVPVPVELFAPNTTTTMTIYNDEQTKALSEQAACTVIHDVGSNETETDCPEGVEYQETQPEQFVFALSEIDEVIQIESQTVKIGDQFILTVSGMSKDNCNTTSGSIQAVAKSVVTRIKPDWHTTLLACTDSSTADTPEKMGLTWGLTTYDSELDLSSVGCHGRPRLDGTEDGPACNPYEGDTSCSIALPILCLKVDDSPRPNYAVIKADGTMEPAFYRGWAGGRIALTEPIIGTDISSPEAADLICAETFGLGYRLAEHHDGKYVPGMDLGEFYGDTWPPASELSSGGWNFFAYSHISDETRFWVHINDQPGNCWD